MKNQISLLIFLCLFIFSCPTKDQKNTNPTDGDTTETPKENPNETPTNPPTSKAIPTFEMEIPKGHTLLQQASGDLNKDGIDEKVVVLNTGQSGDEGEERVLLIFKPENGGWKLWERAYGVIMGSESGGIFGNPFQSVKVERGAVVINHFGGSRIKWDYTHRFRFQNGDWELIGATMITGTECVDQETFDYNVHSGNVIVESVTRTCKNGEKPKTAVVLEKVNFNYKMKSRPTMNGFDYDGVYAVNQNTGTCYPESNCYEYQKLMDEKSQKSKNWRPAGLENLAGVYLRGGHHESWAFEIKCDRSDKNDNVDCTATYFTKDGMIPPIDDFTLEDFTPKVLKKFVVDLTDLTFESDLGKGEIIINDDDKPSIFFKEIKGHFDNELLLDWTIGYSYDH